MGKKQVIKRQIGLFIMVLGLAALACNAPIEGDPTSPPPPTTSAVQTLTPAGPIEEPTAETSPTTETEPTTEGEPTATSEPSPTSRPTFTPIQVTAPPDATATNTPVPTEPAPETPTATKTTAANSGPLNFTYSISWQVDSGNSSVAIATVNIVATGGGGEYQYFRDEVPVDGPNFQYQWATCRANPGSLRVTSADGQSKKVDYFEQPPCPSN